MGIPVGEMYLWRTLAAPYWPPEQSSLCTQVSLGIIPHGDSISLGIGKVRVCFLTSAQIGITGLSADHPGAEVLHGAHLVSACGKLCVEMTLDTGC